MVWLAQTNSRAETAVDGARYCIDHGAAACYLHGGIADHHIAQGRYDDIRAFAEVVRGAGIPAGIAGHMCEDFEWVEGNLDLDFYMVSYYNPSPRQDAPHHDVAAAEQFLTEDRDARVAMIQRLSRPAIHYKVLAAGRTPAREAMAYAARHMRPIDAVCVGVFTKDNPDMLAEDARLLLENLCAVGQCRGD